MILRALVALSLILGLAGFQYANASEEKTWQLNVVNFTSYGLGISHEYRDKVIPIEILRSTGSTDGIGDVAFVCGYGDLNFRLQVVEGDIFQTIQDNLNNVYGRKSNPRRQFRPKIQINGVKAPKAKWIEGLNDRVYMPTEFKTTAQLYNAVIQGGEVRFTRKKKTMVLNLPKPNADFKAFGDSCLKKSRK